MTSYQVVDLSPDGRLASLLDADAVLHVARLHGCALRREDRLRGDDARPGAHLLLMDAHGRPLHLSFESVGCSQDDALRLMHPVDAGNTGRRPPSV